MLETGEAAWIPGELGGNVGQMGQELEKKFSGKELASKVAVVMPYSFS